MGSPTGINFRVLEPETTEVYGPEDAYHVFLRGQKGGIRDWPYRPEVCQRRNNQFAAILAVTLVADRSGLVRHCADEVANDPSLRKDLYGLLRRARTRGADPDPFGRGWEGPSCASEVDVLLIQMKRPAAPQGVEWNAPGGVVKLREDPLAGLQREFAEEAKGMRILSWAHLYENLQFSSGVYREWYDICAVLATGTPQVSAAEGATGKIEYVPLSDAPAWISRQNIMSPECPECCWVDGKILMAVEKMYAHVKAIP